MFETTKWDRPMNAIKYKKIVEKKTDLQIYIRTEQNLDEV